MFAYILRRLLYAIPILIGVNLLTFALFFVVNTPDDMARLQLGVKHVTPEAIERWKAEHGYDKPLLLNAEAAGSAQFTETIFFQHSAAMFVFKFGKSDDGRDIGNEIRTRMGPSLAIALPVFVIGLLVNITFALLMVFFRATYLDLWGVVLCVVLMSISGCSTSSPGVFHRQIVEPAADFGLYRRHRRAQVHPVAGLVSVAAGIGSGARWYRTIFLEEIGKDYVRTARAKGLSEIRVCFATC